MARVGTSSLYNLINQSTPMNPLRRIHHQLARTIQTHRDARIERKCMPQWFLMAGLRDAQARCAPDPAELIPIFPPEDRFWADPFTWSRGGRRHVFFEEYPFQTRLGRISVLELGPGLVPIAPARAVIDEPRHLSYPFLFDYQGQLYMVPESAGSRRIDLYRCIDFPYAWTWECTLMDGIKAADSTLFEHGGRWWLFCSAREGKVRMNESLFAFHAESPVSEHWTPHTANPLIRDYSCGRPGGRIFTDAGGRLIRPAQDSVPRYGFGLRLKMIDTLTPEHYAEQEIWRADARTSGDWHAMHHMDWHSGLLVMDAQRLLRKPALRS